MRNFIVTVDGKQYQVGVEEVGATATTTAAPVVTTVAQKQEVKKAPVAAAPANGEKFLAPMPGMVKKLCFENGAAVKEGDVIVVLEAMKMDNDLTAPCAGTITYRTTEGSNVDTGAVLAIIG